MFGDDQRNTTSCECTVGNRQANEKNRTVMSDSNCSECFCCSTTMCKAYSIPSCSHCQNCITQSRSCKYSWLPNSCKCSSTSHSGRRGSKCSCCSNERQSMWLDYLWKMESEMDLKNKTCTHKYSTPATFRPWSPINNTSKHSRTYRCIRCDSYKRVHNCSSNRGTGGTMEFHPWSTNFDPARDKCLCTDAGHYTHFFCNATDQNNLVARIAALRYKIHKSIKWLLINLAILILTFIEGDFPTIAHLTVVFITFLNACYYIQNLAKLFVAFMRTKLEKPAYRTGNCLWEKNLPLALTRYFEVGGEEFFSRYWSYFSTLLSTLRTVRSSPVGRAETEMGMEAHLRTLGDNIVRTNHDKLKARRQYEDAKYRLPLMKRSKKPICTSNQLAKYWRNYDEACEDEKVRLSREKLPFSPDVTDYQSSSTAIKCREDIYLEVVVASVLRCSSYQNSYRHDVHPSPTVAVGSFHDFMKIHHGKDYCSSLHWVANLKLWLSRKMTEIVEQFDMANRLLVRHVASHVRIGSSSLTVLHNAFRQNEELLTFSPLLEFLSLSHNQTYLVWRYRVLASQPCLTSYTWQGGSDQQGNWAPEARPCDSEIVLHFFCSYMDMKLPHSPFHPAEKRPFSDNYLIRSDKLLQTPVEIAIVRQWTTPPHFNVFVRGRVYEIEGGSNNLFLALAYFIYCIRIYQKGKIGRVSLGRPGLDMLWIVGDSQT